MASKPDGGVAKTQKVVFTRPAAERIAAVVRDYEAGDRDGVGLRFGSRVSQPADKLFRICTFTGAWSINTTKTLTFKNQTNTPNTVVATNIFLGLNPLTSCTVLIAKSGTAWYLAQADLTALQNYSPTSERVFATNSEGLAQWESVAACEPQASAAQISTFLG